MEYDAEISPLCEGGGDVWPSGAVVGGDVTGDRNARTLRADDPELAAVSDERRS